MSRSRLAALALAALVALHPAAASAAGDCASQVQQAEEQARTQYINGMSGLANNNFSQRQGSYTQLACLDKFMQGNMDTLFRPPQLSGLLNQVLSFACQQAKQALGGALGNATNLQSLIGSMSGGGLNLQGLVGSMAGGGVNLGSIAGGGAGGIVNLSSMLGGGGTNLGGIMGGSGSNIIGQTLNQVLRAR